MKTRIEIHLDSKDVKLLDKIATEQGRSRKNFCETEILSIIKSFSLGKGKKEKKKKGNVA